MVGGAAVELRRKADHATVARTETDASGRFDFVQLKPDVYYVHFGKCESCRFSPKLADLNPATA